MLKRLRFTLLALAIIAALWLAEVGEAAAGQAVTVHDDSGQDIVLAEPARRIVSLAPHLTELLYSAGAGERLIAVGSYSDFPPPARELPRVGSHAAIDYERLLALRPDLVLVWQSGNGADVVARLRALGLTVYVSEPEDIAGVAVTLEQLGHLAGTAGIAGEQAAAFRARHAALAARYGDRAEVTVFYQIWDQPLMTVNGEHLISQALELCGGRNVFAGLSALAPTVSVEAVLAADPQAIVGSGDSGEERPEWLDDWRRWPSLRAVAEGNLFSVPPDLIQRHSVRILDGAELLCRQLEQARTRSR